MPGIGSRRSAPRRSSRDFAAVLLAFATACAQPIASETPTETKNELFREGGWAAQSELARVTDMARAKMVDEGFGVESLDIVSVNLEDELDRVWRLRCAHRPSRSAGDHVFVVVDLSKRQVHLVLGR